MDLRKEIQVALNNCQPNTNRVDKIEVIARKYAELYHALQLLQPDVIKSVCKHEYMTDANWKSLTCRLCNDRILPTQTVL